MAMGMRVRGEMYVKQCFFYSFKLSSSNVYYVH